MPSTPGGDLKAQTGTSHTVSPDKVWLRLSSFFDLCFDASDNFQAVWVFSYIEGTNKKLPAAKQLGGSTQVLSLLCRAQSWF